jgi:hypothetical protein
MSTQPTLGLPEAGADQQRRIPIKDTKLRAVVLAMLGLRAAKKVLDEDGKFAHELAGMRVARTLIDREYFELEAEVHRRLVRVMAAAGVDLAAWQAWAFEDGGAAVICRPITEKLQEDER